MSRMLTWVLVCGLAMACAGNALAGKGKGGGKKADPFVTADADKDGKLSATEFATIAKGKHADKQFSKADSNGDGFLSPEELKASLEARADKGGGKGGKKHQK